MMNVNFTDDNYYRYKIQIPKVTLNEQEIQDMVIRHTEVENIPQIANALHRDVEELIQHFSREISPLSSTKEKQKVYVFSGYHEQQEYLDSIKSYVFKYVICYKCQNPETYYQVQQDYILLCCKACGNQTELHQSRKLRLVNFIISLDAKRKRGLKQIEIQKQRTDLQKAQQTKQELTSNMRTFFEQNALLIENFNQFYQTQQNLLKDEELQLHYLHSLEYIVKNNLQLFTENQNLLNSILQQLSKTFCRSTFENYLTQNENIIVSKQFHLQCLEMGAQFFKWFFGEGEVGQEEENEEERVEAEK